MYSILLIFNSCSIGLESLFFLLLLLFFYVLTNIMSAIRLVKQAIADNSTHIPSTFSQTVFSLPTNSCRSDGILQVFLSLLLCNKEPLPKTGCETNCLGVGH